MVKRCLDRLGFDQVNYKFFGRDIIFEIDICSRIAKLVEQFYKEQNEYKRLHPEIISLYVNNFSTYINYIKPRLDDWEKMNFNENSKNNYKRVL